MPLFANSRSKKQFIAAIAVTSLLQAFIALPALSDIRSSQRDAHFIRVTQVGGLDRVKYELCPNLPSVKPSDAKNCSIIGSIDGASVASLEALFGDEKSKATITAAMEAALLAIGARATYYFTKFGLREAALSSVMLGENAGRAWISAGASATATGAVSAAALSNGDLNPWKRRQRAETLLGEKTLRDQDVYYSGGDIQSLANKLGSLLSKSRATSREVRSGH